MRQCVSWFLTEFNSSTTIFTYDGARGCGTTTFTYDAVDRLTQKTKGSGDYETYTYDAADQKTSIGYWFSDGTQHNALVYGYDPAGNVQTVNQGYYTTTYGYDGADQLISESSNGSPPTLGYTYDGNGNRLTQTSNGNQVQSFGYDAHDKLMTGTAGNETDGYDPNGNTTSVSINGVTYHDAYDDEDRLISVANPGGVTDTYTYNGLGLRVAKTDSTGSYAYVCDGASPGSPVLSDGHAMYTPGLSENRGGTASYYSNDLLGNLWTRDASGKNSVTYEDFTWFGLSTAGGAAGSPFGFGGGNGCQTDADFGLVLMGHRYYDTRTGRFLTQDPAGDGDNWYAYAGNNPVNKTDPLGLAPMDGPGSSLVGSPGYSGISSEEGVANNEDFSDDVAYNKQQDLNNAQMRIFFIMDALSMEALGEAITPQLNDITGSASYGASISLGYVRFTGSVGIAYDFVTGKVEFFYQYGGYGKGLSSGLGFTLGNDKLGNFGGFNGPSFNFDILSGKHGVAGFEVNQNYLGGEFSPPGELPPFGYTQYGKETGVFGGFTNTALLALHLP